MFRTFNLVFHAMLVWELIRDRRVPLAKKIIPFIGLAYVLSPIDIIPDFLLGLGQLDDIAIIFLSMRMFENSVPRHVLEEHQQRVTERLQRMAKRSGNATNEPPSRVDARQYTIRFPDESERSEK